MYSSFCRRSYSTFFIFLVSFFLISAASACPPVENPNDVPVDDPVSVTTGIVHSTYDDIKIPGRGLSLEVSRNFYTKSNYIGAFGLSWTWTYGMNITFQSSTVLNLVNENSRREVWTWNGSLWTPPKSNFSTLTKNMDNSWTLRRKDGLTYNFNSDGKLTAITDRNNNQIALTYENNLLTAATDATGKSLTFSYADGKITSITWPNNQVTTYAYDTSGWLSTVTDPEGNAVTYTYGYTGDSFSILSETDPNGNTTQWEYYAQSTDPNYKKCKEIIHADNTRIDFVYNESLRFTLVTDERGHTTRYDYDGNENVTVITDPKGNATTTGYDADFNKTSVTDAKGHITDYGYDNKGNCTSIRDPLNRVSSFTYEPNFCFVKTAADAKGNATTYYYDYEEASLGDLNGDGITNQANGNIVKIVYPTVLAGTPTELFVYNQYGQIIQQTAASGVIARYDYYSATGYLEKKTADYGQINAVTRFEYDALGNVTSVTDPLGKTTTNEYNKIGLLIKSISPPPFNYQTKYYYDGNKNLIRTERQVGQ